MSIGARYLKAKNVRQDIIDAMASMLRVNEQIGDNPVFVEKIGTAASALSDLASELDIQIMEMDEEMRRKYAP